MAGNVQAGGLELVLTANAAQVVAAAAEAKAALQGVGTAAKEGGKEAVGALAGIDVAIGKVKEATHEMAGVMRAIGHVMIPVEIAKTFFEIGTKIGEFLFKTKEQEAEVEEQVRKTTAAINEQAEAWKKNLPANSGFAKTLNEDIKAADDLQKKIRDARATYNLTDTQSIENEIAAKEGVMSSEKLLDLKEILKLEEERAAIVKRLQDAASSKRGNVEKQEAEKEAKEEAKRVEDLEKLKLEAKLKGSTEVEGVEIRRAQALAEAEKKYKAQQLEEAKKAINSIYNYEQQKASEAAEAKSEAEMRAIEERKNAYINLIYEQQYKQMESDRKVAAEHLKQLKQIADTMKQMQQQLDSQNMSGFSGSISALAQAVQQLGSRI